MRKRNFLTLMLVLLLLVISNPVTILQAENTYGVRLVMENTVGDKLYGFSYKLYKFADEEASSKLSNAISEETINLDTTNEASFYLDEGYYLLVETKTAKGFLKGQDIGFAIPSLFADENNVLSIRPKHEIIDEPEPTEPTQTTTKPTQTTTRPTEKPPTSSTTTTQPTSTQSTRPTSSTTTSIATTTKPMTTKVSKPSTTMTTTITTTIITGPSDYTITSTKQAGKTEVPKVTEEEKNFIHRLVFRSEDVATRVPATGENVSITPFVLLLAASGLIIIKALAKKE